MTSLTKKTTRRKNRVRLGVQLPRKPIKREPYELLGEKRSLTLEQKN
ncbi:hypothetical protein PC116_g34634 [Phytophthora cactorum]|nr:hypothetical protein PC116_g34634 [Phytophthora cactorum]